MMALQTAVAAGVVSQVLVPAFRSALLSRAVASCLNAAARLSPVSNPLNDAAGPNVLEQGEVRRVLTELDNDAALGLYTSLGGAIREADTAMFTVPLAGSDQGSKKP